MDEFDHRLLRTVFDAQNVGLIVLDADRCVIAWNAWIARASGIPPEAALGKRLHDVFAGERLSRLDAAATQAIASGVSSILTYALHPALLPLRTQANQALIHNVAVQPLGEAPSRACLIQIEDVTASAHRERVLRERQNARYHAVVSSAPDAILTLDADGSIQFANPAVARELGYTSAELAGRRVVSLLHDAAAWEDIWRRVLAGEVLSRPHEIVAVRKDGSLSYLEVSASRWLSGSQVFVTAILREINERRAAEEALRNLNQTLEQRVEERTAELMLAEERLRQAQKMEAVGQLTGGMAHDFNNLLAVILGNAEVIAEDTLALDQVQAHARQILDAAERGADLNQKLLAFGRRQSLQPQLLDVTQVVGGIVTLLRRTLGEQIELQRILHPSSNFALTDRTLLESALLNLAVNARDAMARGGTLTITTGERVAGPSEGPLPIGQAVVFVTVADTGTGMSQDVLARAFEPFFTTKDVGKGSGLGLSMVYGFAQQTGGHVSIESKEGEGTRVTLVLPAVAPAAEDAEASDGPCEAQPGREWVLLVEDEANVRQFVSWQLNGLGYEVTAVSSGPDALELLKRERFDLLFTDVMLPKGMSGVELARQARQIRPDLRVLLTSGYPEDVFQQQGLPDEDTLLLRKPYRRKDLADMLRRAIAGEGGTS